METCEGNGGIEPEQCQLCQKLDSRLQRLEDVLIKIQNVQERMVSAQQVMLRDHIRSEDTLRRIQLRQEQMDTVQDTILRHHRESTYSPSFQKKIVEALEAAVTAPPGRRTAAKGRVNGKTAQQQQGGAREQAEEQPDKRRRIEPQEDGAAARQVQIDADEGNAAGEQGGQGGKGDAGDEEDDGEGRRSKRQVARKRWRVGRSGVEVAEGEEEQDGGSKSEDDGWPPLQTIPPHPPNVPDEVELRVGDVRGVLLVRELPRSYYCIRLPDGRVGSGPDFVQAAGYSRHSNWMLMSKVVREDGTQANVKAWLEEHRLQTKMQLKMSSWVRRPDAGSLVPGAGATARKKAPQDGGLGSDREEGPANKTGHQDPPPRSDRGGDTPPQKRALELDAADAKGKAPEQPRSFERPGLGHSFLMQAPFLGQHWNRRGPATNAAPRPQGPQPAGATRPPDIATGSGMEEELQMVEVVGSGVGHPTQPSGLEAGRLLATVSVSNPPSVDDPQRRQLQFQAHHVASAGAPPRDADEEGNGEGPEAAYTQLANEVQGPSKATGTEQPIGGRHRDIPEEVPIECDHLKGTLLVDKMSREQYFIRMPDGSFLSGNLMSKQAGRRDTHNWRHHCRVIVDGERLVAQKWFNKVGLKTYRQVIGWGPGLSSRVTRPRPRARAARKREQAHVEKPVNADAVTDDDADVEEQPGLDSGDGGQAAGRLTQGAATSTGGGVHDGAEGQDGGQRDPVWWSVQQVGQVASADETGGGIGPSGLFGGAVRTGLGAGAEQEVPGALNAGQRDVEALCGQAEQLCAQVEMLCGGAVGMLGSDTAPVAGAQQNPMGLKTEAGDPSIGGGVVASTSVTGAGQLASTSGMGEHGTGNSFSAAAAGVAGEQWLFGEGGVHVPGKLATGKAGFLGTLSMGAKAV